MTAMEAPPVGPTELEYAARELEQSPVPRDPSELTAKQRHQLALDLLARNAGKGEPELTAQVLMGQAGVSYHTAYAIKKEWRGGAKSYPKGRVYRRKAPITRTPKEESWAIIQDFLDAHQGQDFSRNELAKATGVPPSTVTALWQQKLGVAYSDRATAQTSQPAPRAGMQIATRPARDQVAEALDQPWAFEIGAQLTICGFHGGRILADCDGTLYSLPPDITRLA